MKSETQDQTQALDVPSSLPVFCDGLSLPGEKRVPTSQVKRSEPTSRWGHAGYSLSTTSTSPNFHVEAEHYLNCFMIYSEKTPLFQPISLVNVLITLATVKTAVSQ